MGERTNKKDMSRNVETMLKEGRVNLMKWESKQKVLDTISLTIYHWENNLLSGKRRPTCPLCKEAIKLGGCGYCPVETIYGVYCLDMSDMRMRYALGMRKIAYLNIINKLGEMRILVSGIENW